VRILGALEARERCEREEAERVEPLDPACAERAQLPGAATRAGAARLARRCGTDGASFYRPAQDLSISSVGVGTYRGALDRATDSAYAEAVRAALRSGMNLLDTAINYRCQRSEISVGAALAEFVAEDGGSRDEVVVCTKGGFVVPDAFTAGTLGPGDVVGGVHSLAPAFLADQIERSRGNLGVETIDVYYLHNPETQLDFLEAPELRRRLGAAFEALEEAVVVGSIRYYGVATWNGLRGGRLAVRDLVALAEEVAGAGHRFRFVQLPLNMGMREGVSVAELGAELGLTMVASAALLQGLLTAEFPDELVRLLPGLESDGQRALQFARSAPGIAAALVGMRRVAHVQENAALSARPPLSGAELERVAAALAA
jgi:aryl-alcohol dehydrogenase-like predicted oxidoreductase